MANLLFENARARRPQSVPPVWMMRQAGRYHAHYQALRAKHSFVELCKQPELAAEVAMGPIRDFDFDVAILFSDILFPLEAMGMGLSYDPAPKLAWQLSAANVHQLRGVDDAMPSLEFQGAAMRATRSVLSNEKSLIGFVGGPWTLFGYAVEGSHKGGLIQAKRNLALYSAFCANLLPLIERNIELQLKNGAEIVMIFDTAAGELAPELYSEMVAPTVEALVRKFPGRIGYYAKAIQASYLSAPFFSEPGLLAGLGFDHHWSMRALLNGSAFKNKHNGFIQGNFDQALLFSDIDQLARRLKQYLEPIRQLDVDSRAGWVCGLGHGVLPQTPEANVRSFVTTIREVFSR